MGAMKDFRQGVTRSNLVSDSLFLQQRRLGLLDRNQVLKTCMEKAPFVLMKDDDILLAWAPLKQLGTEMAKSFPSNIPEALRIMWRGVQGREGVFCSHLGQEVKP